MEHRRYYTTTVSPWKAMITEIKGNRNKNILTGCCSSSSLQNKNCSITSVAPINLQNVRSWHLEVVSVLSCICKATLGLHLIFCTICSFLLVDISDILRLMVLLERGTFEIWSLASWPRIVSTNILQAEPIMSSPVVWDFVFFGQSVLQSKEKLQEQCQLW